MIHKTKLAALGLTLTLTAGCGLRSVVVPNLDWIVTRQINESLNLSGEKKESLQKDVATLLEGAKPQVKRIQARLKTLDLESADIFKETSDLGEEYEVFVKSFAPVYAKYLSELTPRQIEKFKKYNEKENDKILERKKKALEKGIDGYERFLGDLTKPQTELLKLNSQVFIELQDRRLKRRQDYQGALYKILAFDDPQKRKQEIVQLTLNYNKLLRENPARKKSLHLVKEVLKLSTPEQKNHFREKVDEYLPWLEAYLEEDFT